ncbi:hypothetical protein HL658_33700 [Azospirillum sp. RWY-5-1]|uniref:Glycosyltransferase RgtA/B/C/D-like domain-containing protein n=1 Tax=Azospirillum oleiclasticum TaxID=2735135 RepID=A0ABX2TJU5_9PROT|nr:hypothetical protein [Azospirillum oleiclasticum]NYZ17524.1 hypothetical protein [Azospirillum oleiclasticum]NYZ24626.1 hypothetical protein [Azospirillum oleiclasticum]
MIRKHLPAVLLCGLLTALALPAILLDIRLDTGVAADSVQVHVPQMNLFVADPFAPLDHKAYVASIPLYHMAFAAAARAMGIGTIEHGMTGLRLLNGGLGLLLILCAVRLLGRTEDPLRPLLLLPLTVSWFTVQSTAYFGTDVAGLLMLALFLLAVRSGLAGRGLAGRGAAGLAMVGTRHLLAPTLFAPTLARAFTRDGRRFSPRETAAELLPALALLAVHAVAWGGLVPPGITPDMNAAGLFPAAGLHALAYLGVMAFIFGPVRAADLRRFLGGAQTRRLVIAALAAGAVVWLAVPSSFDPAAGRWGSVVWSIARYSPSLLDRSLPLLPLVLAGALLAAYVLETCRRMGGMPLEIAALLCCLGGLVFVSPAYQRYPEPVALLTLALFFGRLPSPESGPDRGRAPAIGYLPLLLFSAAYIAADAAKLYLS